MDFDEFLEHLRQSKSVFKWAVRHGCIIRGKRTRLLHPSSWGANYCPLTAVCLSLTGHQVSVASAVRASRKLGMSAELVIDVIMAADYGRNWNGQEQIYRTRMLDALGLEETTHV